MTVLWTAPVPSTRAMETRTVGFGITISNAFWEENLPLQAARSRTQESERKSVCGVTA